MRASQRTQGATLIVSLLLVTFLLAAIMAVTAQVTLSTRRTSADQQQLLGARYAAESGLSRVQARLSAMHDLLRAAALPATTGNATVEGYLLDMCGLATLPASGTVCTFPRQGLRSGSDASNPKVALFSAAVGSAAFRQAGFSAGDDAARSTFWSQLLSGTAGTTYSGGTDSTYQTTFGLVPTQLERVGGQSYRLHFTVPSVTATGLSGQARQTLNARATNPAYYIQISRGSFARYALFANHFYGSEQAEASDNRIYFTSRTVLSGPVHTNQHFMFEGTPWFGGEVTSAGCPQGQIGPVGGAEGCQATTQPGAYFGASARQFLSPGQMNSPTAPSYGNTQPGFTGGVTWATDFIPLPQNNSDQYADAQRAGLALTGRVNELRLQRDTIAGQERQRITYTQGTKTAQLSYAQDGQLQILDASGAWVNATRDASGAIVPGTPTPPLQFNGVIAVRDNPSDPTDRGEILNLNGGPNVTQAGADGATIASFAGLTVAATGDITVTSDLKYTLAPCTGSNAPGAPAPCPNLSARNILGVYSSAGDIVLLSPASGQATNLGSDPTIHAILMSSRGAVRVEGYNRGAALGSVNLLGGIIENYYGPFGEFNRASGAAVHGYGRNFVYDQRTYDGYTPPSFPTQQRWTLGLNLTGTGQPVDAAQGIRLQGDVVSAGRGWTP